MPTQERLDSAAPSRSSFTPLRPRWEFSGFGGFRSVVVVFEVVSCTRSTGFSAPAPEVFCWRGVGWCVLEPGRKAL